MSLPGVRRLAIFIALLHCVIVAAGFDPGCGEVDGTGLALLVPRESFKRNFIFTGDLWLLAAEDCYNDFVPICLVIFTQSSIKMLLFNIIKWHGTRACACQPYQALLTELFSKVGLEVVIFETELDNFTHF